MFGKLHLSCCFKEYLFVLPFNSLIPKNLILTIFGRLSIAFKEGWIFEGPDSAIFSDVTHHI